MLNSIQTMLFYTENKYFKLHDRACYRNDNKYSAFLKNTKKEAKATKLIVKNNGYLTHLCCTNPNNSKNKDSITKKQKNRRSYKEGYLKLAKVATG